MIEEILTDNGVSAESSLPTGVAHIAVRFSDDFSGDPGSVVFEYAPADPPSPPANTEMWESLYSFHAHPGLRRDILATVADSTGRWRFRLKDRTSGTVLVTAKSG